MTRKRAVKLLMSVTRAGERKVVQDTMGRPRYNNLTNAEKVAAIAMDFAVAACIVYDTCSADRAIDLIERLQGGEGK